MFQRFGTATNEYFIKLTPSSGERVDDCIKRRKRPVMTGWAGAEELKYQLLRLAGNNQT